MYVLGTADSARALLIVARDGAELQASLTVGEILRATGEVELLDPSVRDEIPEDLRLDVPDGSSGAPILLAHGIRLAARE